jgi:8-oxo-dGTP diphosphatase
VAAIVPQRLDGESEELRWVRVRDVTALPLHSGFAAGWPHVQPLLARREVVVVDAANVVGSRPDGWWNDRTGAAQRLLDSLDALASRGVAPVDGLLADVPGRSAAWPDWVVVLEGRARGAQAPATVRVVDAQASGDDAIVHEAATAALRGHDVTVVTADRELRQRVAEVGARSVGPRLLLTLLD